MSAQDCTKHKLCSIDGCDCKVVARGWCQKHYCRWKRHGNPLKSLRDISLEERFFKQVNKTAGCWLWTGCMTDDGYGRLGVNGIVERAHRVSWKLKNGPIPDGLHVLHKCDTPACVNHDDCLFLGTNQDNVDDRESKGRGVRLIGERHGCAKLAEKEVLEVRDLHDSGMLTYKEISSIYKISISSVSYIVRRETWAHI